MPEQAALIGSTWEIRSVVDDGTAMVPEISC
jgi:hypothetical protein